MTEGQDLTAKIGPAQLIVEVGDLPGGCAVRIAPWLHQAGDGTAVDRLIMALAAAIPGVEVRIPHGQPGVLFIDQANYYDTLHDKPLGWFNAKLAGLFVHAFESLSQDRDYGVWNVVLTFPGQRFLVEALIKHLDIVAGAELAPNRVYGDMLLRVFVPPSRLGKGNAAERSAQVRNALLTLLDFRFTPPPAPEPEQVAQEPEAPPVQHVDAAPPGAPQPDDTAVITLNQAMLNGAAPSTDGAAAPEKPATP